MMPKQSLPIVFAVLGLMSLYAACAPVEDSRDDAAVSEQPDATLVDASIDDAAMSSAAEVLAGVWVQTLQSYPGMHVIWSMHPDGWGNIDVRLDNASDTWCRNYVDWTISSETSSSEFVYSYTFTQPSCGESQQGDTLTVNVFAEITTEPLTLRTDWGGGASMQLCGRDFSQSDLCAEGNDLGSPAMQP